MLRKITKGEEPASLGRWKRNNPNKRYHQIQNQDSNVRQDMREQSLEEQFYLCGYCCQHITDHTQCVNEHVEAQGINPNRTLDFNNIIASCKKLSQCDDAHKSQPLPLTPLMDECETEIRFKLSGRVEGVTERSRDAIRVLNLGDHERHNKILVEKRKQLISTMLFPNGVDAIDDPDDPELTEMLIEDISTPRDGKLESFSPVLVNVLRQRIS